MAFSEYMNFIVFPFGPLAHPQKNLRNHCPLTFTLDCLDCQGCLMSESTPASLFHICTPKQTLSSYFVLEIPYFDLIFTLIFEAIFLFFLL